MILLYIQFFAIHGIGFIPPTNFLDQGGAHAGDRSNFDNYLAHYRDFSDFVFDLPNAGLPPIVHMKPMHYFLELAKNKTLLDYFGYYEELENAYLEILSRIPRPPLDRSSQLCRENVTKHKRAEYQDEYTGRMADIVGSIYHRDSILFGYTFDSFSRASAKFCCREKQH